MMLMVQPRLLNHPVVSLRQHPLFPHPDESLYLEYSLFATHALQYSRFSLEYCIRVYTILHDAM